LRSFNLQEANELSRHLRREGIALLLVAFWAEGNGKPLDPMCLVDELGPDSDRFDNQKLF